MFLPGTVSEDEGSMSFSRNREIGKEGDGVPVLIQIATDRLKVM